MRPGIPSARGDPPARDPARRYNDAAEMQRMIDSGAAILITDKPDLAKTLLKR